MNIPMLKTLKNSARWIRSRFYNGALILGYHRIVDGDSWDPYFMRVGLKHFAAHLEAIRKYAYPISLETLTEGLRGGDLPRNAVVLTFDDGYADILYHAKPLLEYYQVPATVFVTTGYLGREFWWDELERMLLSPSNIPCSLDIVINGSTFSWSADDIMNSYAGRDATDTRKDLFLSVYRKLLSLSSEEQRNVIDQLRSQIGTASLMRLKCRALREDEIVTLAEGSLVEVGAHTVSHSCLSNLPKDVQSSEIEQSKACLEDILGQSVKSMSYPNGSISEDTPAIVQETGFDCACTSVSDATRRGCNLFKLPRLWISDQEGEMFSRWLKRWLHG